MPSTYTPRVWLGSNGSYWRATWRDEDGASHARGLGSKAKVSQRAAEQARHALALELASKPGLQKVGKVPRLGEWLDSYLARRKDLGADARCRYRRVAFSLTEFFGNRSRIDELIPSDGTRWYLALRAGRIRGISPDVDKPHAPLTIERYLSAAFIIFEEARAEQVIVANPVAHLCQSDLIRQTEEIPEGPREPNIVRIDGEDHTVRRQDWFLINALWSAEAISEDELVDIIWGAAGADDDQVRKLASRTNKSLSELGLQWRVRRSVGYFRRIEPK